mmetsp:Transcript_10831/g.14340  ORF Transcript_10831/g.14340 Transcript_10831/m.14340 type:complete len:149 (-) Transcript_10831:17-463(-)
MVFVSAVLSRGFLRCRRTVMAWLLKVLATLPELQFVSIQLNDPSAWMSCRIQHRIEIDPTAIIHLVSPPPNGNAAAFDGLLHVQLRSSILSRQEYDALANGLVPASFSCRLQSLDLANCRIPRQGYIALLSALKIQQISPVLELRQCF